MIRIGMDVGGTGIQIGVVDEQGTILDKDSIRTRTDLPFEEQVKRRTTWLPWARACRA